jgi:hypothetical protein
MKRRDDAARKPSALDGTGEQPGVQPAAGADAAAEAAPDGDAASQVTQHGGAVWDQPLPWVTPLDGTQHQRPEQPRPPQAEPPAGAVPLAEAEPPGKAEPLAEVESPALQVAALRHGDGDDTEASYDDTKPQPTAVEPQRGAHATTTPLRAGAAGGHAVSKWVLGSAVAACVLIAVVGGFDGGTSHPSAAPVKEVKMPVSNPVAGGDRTTSPTPTPTPTGPAEKHTAKNRAENQAKSHSAPHSAPLVVVAGAPEENASPVPTSTEHASSSDNSARSAAPGSLVPSDYLTLVSTPRNGGDDKYVIQNIIIKISAPVTRLTVDIDIAPPDVSAGNQSYSTSSECTYSSHTVSGGLVFTWTLNAGDVLAPGKYTFGAGYFHDPGRSTARDTYTVQATAKGTDTSKTLRGYVN